MNKPDGITQDAWDRGLACVDLYLRDVDISPQEAIARSIQSAVEAEREAILNEVSTISGLLRHYDTPKSALQHVRSAILTRKGA